MKLIPVHRRSTKELLYINADHIEAIGKFDGETRINVTAFDGCYTVTESVEKVIQLIREAEKEVRDA